jgi:hypothetical protein
MTEWDFWVKLTVHTGCKPFTAQTAIWRSIITAKSMREHKIPGTRAFVQMDENNWKNKSRQRTYRNSNFRIVAWNWRKLWQEKVVFFLQRTIGFVCRSLTPTCFTRVMRLPDFSYLRNHMFQVLWAQYAIKNQAANRWKLINSLWLHKNIYGNQVHVYVCIKFLDR